jgi:hypothetical protein
MCPLPSSCLADLFRVCLTESRRLDRPILRPPAFGAFTMIYARTRGPRSIWPSPTSDCGDNNAGLGRIRGASLSRGPYGDGGRGQTIDVGRISDRPAQHGDSGPHARLRQPRLALALADDHPGTGRRPGCGHWLILDPDATARQQGRRCGRGDQPARSGCIHAARPPRRRSLALHSISHRHPPRSADPIGSSLPPVPRPGPAMARRPDPISLPFPLLRNLSHP